MICVFVFGKVTCKNNDSIFTQHPSEDLRKEDEQLETLQVATTQWIEGGYNTNKHAY